ncbi:hypothetical protein [Mesorhizobium sp. ORS 3428]|uniref:hypothetical protein n=1 Tax=Mesorhizobium sp. ORS 3428 TaxID=540997 RepID=UPI0008DAEFE4|nr:hypothetical protein [Mesorhizobium sp. ORS 3428]OHV90436.1 hypothetical protein ORS3428_01685 [Mesorhizobium sp. ORS 3428]
MAELYGFVWMGALLVIFGGLYWAATARGRRRYQDFIERWTKAREESIANTKALEENTAAIRELMRKWDEKQSTKAIQ